MDVCSRREDHPTVRPRYPQWLALILMLLGALPVRAGAEDERLLQVVSADDPAHEEALAWWEELAPEGRVRALRAALASADPKVAEVGAATLGYPYLDGVELRRAHRLMRAHPLRYFETPEALDPLVVRDDNAFGSPDVVPYFEAAVRNDTIDHRSYLERAHRSLRSEHVEALVPLLEKGNAFVFTGVLWSIGQIGEHDRRDRFRDVIARGLLYGLRRLRAERAGTERPKLADVHVEVISPEGGGLPEALLEIAGACFDDGPESWEAGDATAVLSVVQPYWWLRRWMVALTPAPKDAPFLERIVEAVPAETPPYGPDCLLWAMRGLARMPEQIERVRTWAGQDDERGLYAAAALAEQGEPASFQRLVAALEGREDEEPGPNFRDLEWLVDRPRARARTAADILGEIANLEPLTGENRMWMRRTQDIVIDDDDLAWIEAELWQQRAPLLTLLAWHTRIRPGRLTAERAGQLLDRLGAMPALDWRERTLDDYDPLLAELELLAPDRTRALLAHWLETQPTAQEEILQRLARLGVPGNERAMCATWLHWEEDRRWALGRVPGEAVATFLWQVAEGPDGEAAVGALEALLVRAGLDPKTRALTRNWILQHEEAPTVAQPAFRRALDRLNDGDAAGALLEIVQGEFPPYPLSTLGTVVDARITAYLQRLRRERHLERYWDATAALAIGGDAAAHAEFLTLIEDDRTWIVDSQQDSGLGDDRSLTDMLLERLDSNCCLGWAAHTLLKVIYPTLPFDDGYGGAGTVWTRDWLAQFDWKRSALVDGWVPVRK